MVQDLIGKQVTVEVEEDFFCQDKKIIRIYTEDENEEEIIVGKDCSIGICIGDKWIGRLDKGWLSGVLFDFVERDSKAYVKIDVSDIEELVKLFCKAGMRKKINMEEFFRLFFFLIRLGYIVEKECGRSE